MSAFLLTSTLCAASGRLHLLNHSNVMIMNYEQNTNLLTARHQTFSYPVIEVDLF